ncbi:MAG: hypothetical protein EOP86_20975 [Verrucomicrobiaceae bacterium]|nr:MAG: hypothetical protein EOP86_20975 [Verrucomicrobiaceae bacterium]
MRGGVTFKAEFEAGSKWFTEPWSAEARAEMEAYLSDLGRMFNTDAQVSVTVTVTDDEHSAYARCGPDWSYPTSVTGRTGMFIAPSLWWIIVKGTDRNGAASDVSIHWNLDLNLYGTSAALIGNIRGLARHEMHHAFGSLSGLYHDSRGKAVKPWILDSLYKDAEDKPVIGDRLSDPLYSLVNFYTLYPNWGFNRNSSGIHFEGRDIRGRIVKMPPISFAGAIDFSHLTGISYTSDHPSWRNYEDTDRSFLRALGYPLTVDAELPQRAAVGSFRVSTAEARIGWDSQLLHYYRLATSQDLKNWTVLPQGISGTGYPLEFAYPLGSDTGPSRFFQIIEVP